MCADVGDEQFECTTDPSGQFELTSDGLLQVRSGHTLDHDVSPEHDVDVTVTDAAGHSFTQTLSIAVQEAGGVADEYLVREDKPGPDVQTDDERMDFGRGIGTTAFHLMGTCRMGPASDPSTVVDDTLSVHGMEGLRVVDASVMPTMPSANTNASTLMIAEKAADMILGRTPPEAANV